MQRAILTLVSGLFLMSCAAVPHPAVAAEKPNILVMGEDAEDAGAGGQIVVVPRDNRVFKQVLEALTRQLNEEGFNIYDERAVTLDDFKQTRTRRADAELIDIARSVQRPPIDLVVMFTIYAGAKKGNYVTDVYTRISGRTLNVKTGQKLGSFEVTSPKEWKAPHDCSRDCLFEVIGKNAKVLADDLGAVMARQIAMVVDRGDSASASTPGGSNLPTAYTLVFSGFTPEEVTSIEEYIVAFGGYKHHRPIRSSLRRAEYWYETSSESARLNRNMRLMLDRLGAEGRVTYSSSENTLTVEKIAQRKQR
jgi:hypothetical protein